MCAFYGQNWCVKCIETMINTMNNTKEIMYLLTASYNVLLESQNSRQKSCAHIAPFCGFHIPP